MKLLYIHGLSSSGASSTPRNLRELLPGDEIISPDVPLVPMEAIKLLRDICLSETPDIVIGTSMGGMFAQQMHGFKKIIINPSFYVSRSLRRITGTNRWFNPRVDGAETFEVTAELCQQYEEMELHQFDGITDFDRENTYGLFGVHDKMVNCLDVYRQYYSIYDRFDGEHRLSLSNITETIIPLIERIFLRD